MARKETFVWHCAVSHCLGDKPRPIGRWTTWKFWRNLTPSTVNSLSLEANYERSKFHLKQVWVGELERAKNRTMYSCMLSKQAPLSELNINEMCAYIVATWIIKRTENQLHSLFLPHKLEFVMRWTVSQRFVTTLPYISSKAIYNFCPKECKQGLLTTYHNDR